MYGEGERTSPLLSARYFIGIAGENLFPVAIGAGGCPYNAAVPPGLFCGRAFSPGLSSQWVVAALIGVLFLRMLGIFVVLPVVSVAAQALQPTAGDWAVGLALGGYGVTQACMQMPVGLLADRWGRKPVLFFALSLFTLGGVVAGATEDVRWLVVGRLLQGAGAVATVAIAWMMDVSGEERRARVMAGLGGAIGFAFVCSLFVAGPLVGGGRVVGGLSVCGGDGGGVHAVVGADSFAAALFRPAAGWVARFAGGSPLVGVRCRWLCFAWCAGGVFFLVSAVSGFAD